MALALAAVVHVYWALGGARGFRGAVPERASGQKLFRPRRAATLVVAGMLLGAAALLAARSGFVAAAVPDILLQAGCGLLAAIFLARAVGDFRYVGFFKRARGSRFAKLDDAFYSPLCVFLAVASAVCAS